MIGVFGILWWLSYGVAVVGLSIFGLHRYFMLYLYYKHKRDHIVPTSRFADLPRVTVQVPVFNERYVVERLIDSVAELDYPRELLEIQVLDDSTDDTRELAAQKVARLHAQGLNIHHIHRINRTGFKAGALAAGLNVATGEFIAIFDADFLPQSSLLMESIHHFTDPNIGMIQTRWGHLNRNFSMLTRVQSLFLDGHLLIEQTARNRSNRFFNFNGTAGVWRRSCIEDAGGWQHDTLTEDLDLSYRAQLKGWKFVFLSDLVTPAELPVEMNAFKTQQHRWAKGSVQTCKKILPAVWKSGLPLPVKIEATFHLTSNFAYLLLFVMCLLVNPYFSPKPVNFWRELLFINLPIFAMASLSVIVFYFCVLRELSREWWRELWCIPALVALGVGMSVNNGKAVVEAILNHQTPFARTPKYGIQHRGEGWRKKQYFAVKDIVPAIEVAVCCYFAYFILVCWQTRLWTNLPVLLLFFTGFFYVACMSLFQQHLPVRVTKAEA